MILWHPIFYIAEVYGHLTITPIRVCWTSHFKPMGINMDRAPFAAITTITLLGRLSMCLWGIVPIHL